MGRGEWLKKHKGYRKYCYRDGRTTTLGMCTFRRTGNNLLLDWLSFDGFFDADNVEKICTIVVFWMSSLACKFEFSCTSWWGDCVFCWSFDFALSCCNLFSLASSICKRCFSSAMRSCSSLSCANNFRSTPKFYTSLGWDKFHINSDITGKITIAIFNFWLSFSAITWRSFKNTIDRPRIGMSLLLSSMNFCKMFWIIHFWLQWSFKFSSSWLERWDQERFDLRKFIAYKEFD